MPDPKTSRVFSKTLLQWFIKNARLMPWRDLKNKPDPYRVWISEIMLQQTTVATVSGFYARWLQAYPSVRALAKGEEQSVLKQWQGLGYYNRARNLLKCARLLVQQYAGELPDTVEDLQKLPGFGPYTAAAVASIAFGRPAPLVDANVRRVMMRVLGINGVISTVHDTVILKQLSQWIPLKDPGHFNQALMELGALVCRPKEPVCNQCPVRLFCKAYSQGIQELIPRPKIRMIKQVNAVVGIIEHNGKVLIQQRPAKKLFAGLWEFPGGKVEPEDRTAQEALRREILEEIGAMVTIGKSLGTVSHSYTQFRARLTAFICALKEKPARLPLNARWVFPGQLEKYPMPSGSAKVLDKYFSFKKIVLLLCLGSALFLTGPACAEAAPLKSKFAPPDGKVLLIIGQDKISIDEYRDATGIVPGGTMFYTSVQDADGLEIAADHGGGIHHGQYLVDQYPDSVLQIGLWMVGALEGIANGKFDRNIDKIGAWIKKTKRPVFLRIGYEFDFPGNQYAPREYRRAFRYIVRRFRQTKVANAAFVWHSYANLPQHRWEDWYPGDDVVDWFAISVFERPNIYMKKFAELARRHHKGLMIAESTPQGLGIEHGEASWKFWFEPLFQFIVQEKVQIVSYIDYNWEMIPMFKGQGWRDARVQSNEAVKQAWENEVLQDKYLHASPELFKILY